MPNNEPQTKYVTYDQFERSLNLVRDAYNKMVQAMRKQQERMKQLENRIAELEKQREQQEKQATAVPEHPAVASQPEQTHHTTKISEGQMKLAYALTYQVGIQPADMREWVKQKYGKELEDLDQRKDFPRLKALLEQAKGKGVLPTLQLGREYSNAS